MGLAGFELHSDSDSIMPPADGRLRTLGRAYIVQVSDAAEKVNRSPIGMPTLKVHTLVVVARSNHAVVARLSPRYPSPRFSSNP